MWQNRDIKLVKTKKKSYLVSEPNYHTTIFFFLCKFISHISEKEKNMNKSVCLGLSILEICNILMWEFWYDFVKPKYGEKAKLYDMDTDSYIVYIKTEDIYPDIEKDVETRFDTSNYELDRPLSKGKK